MALTYVKPERLSLKLHPEFDEKWVQERIAEDPSILGLGDVVLRDKERPQPNAGRLDLLLQDPETLHRYEVELQLGATDETHIIRTIEYWDIERKRYPQYEHTAVIVAENITSRFLNVASLFNGTIPLIAIQFAALKVEDKIVLHFAKVMDELSRGLVDEDEEADAVPADRDYWEKRGSALSLKLTDELLEIAWEHDPSLQLNYNKGYIGITKDSKPMNFILFKPKKKHVNLEIKLPHSEEIDARLNDEGIDTNAYSRNFGYYKLPIRQEDLDQHRATLKELMGLAYQERIS